jgi:hypothetical protein
MTTSFLTRNLLKVAVALVLFAGIFAFFQVHNTAEAASKTAASSPYGSCSNNYTYWNIARQTTPTPVALNGTTYGIASATLWEKVYLNTHNVHINCHQYHSIVTACIAPGQILPFSLITASVTVRNGSGLSIDGQHQQTFGILVGGTCASVASYDTLPTQTYAGSTALGTGSFDGIGIAVTTAFAVGR